MGMLWKSDLPRLYQGMVRGDLAAAEQLWKLVEPRLSAIIRRAFRLPAADIDRLVAEAFENLWLHGRGEIRDPWRYLLSACYRGAAGCFRASRARHSPPDEIPERLPPRHHEREVDFRDQFSAWLRARGKLSLRMLELMAAGHDSVEIARDLGVSRRTLRRRLQGLR